MSQPKKIFTLDQVEANIKSNQITEEYNQSVRDLITTTAKLTQAVGELQEIINFNSR